MLAVDDIFPCGIHLARIHYKVQDKYYISEFAKDIKVNHFE